MVGQRPPCTMALNCTSHALSATQSADGWSCKCACRNYWVGAACSVCPYNYSSADCDVCPVGTLKPTCRACRSLQDCNAHAVSVTVNADGTQCACTCRNQWLGRNCSVCDASKYSGVDCDRCAPGLVEYPYCRQDVVVDVTAETEKCITKCRAAGCASQTVAKVGGEYMCSCSTCLTQARVCALPSPTNGLTKKTICIYPVDKCLPMNGADLCVVILGGVKRWKPCGAC